MSERRLTDWLDSYLLYTEESEPPKLFHIWTAISTVAAALQRKCVLNLGTLEIFPNMYIVLVAPSGKARKGTAMRFGDFFLSKLGIKMAADANSREALIQSIISAYDSSIDEASGEMSFHSSLTIHSQEFVVFLGHNQQNLMTNLIDWYDCGKGPEGKWNYKTVGRGVEEISGLWVNLLGATTPELLRLYVMEAIGAGLTSRIIFVYQSDKYKTCPLTFLNDEQTRIGEDLYYDLEKIYMLRGKFKPSKDFIDAWIPWYTKQDKQQVFEGHPHLAPYCERRGMHILKLSLILSACRSSSMVIEAQDLKRAVEILEHTELTMPYVFSGTGRSPHAEVLSRVMNDVGLAGEIPLSVIQRKYYHDADARVLNLIIETLQGMKFLSVIDKGNEIILKHCKGRGSADETTN